MKTNIPTRRTVAIRGNELLVEIAGRVYLFASQDALAGHYVCSEDSFKQGTDVLVRQGWEILAEAK
jgi:hypothetical protein